MFESYDDILTVEEACEALKIGYNAINTGKLRGYRNGRVWRIPKAAVVECVMEKARMELSLSIGFYVCKVRKKYFEILYLAKMCRVALCNSQISVAVQGKDQQRGGLRAKGYVTYENTQKWPGENGYFRKSRGDDENVAQNC